MLGICCGFLFAIGNVLAGNLILWGFVFTTLFIAYLIRKSQYYKKFLFLLPFLLVFAIVGGLNTYIKIVRFDLVYIPQMEYQVEGKVVQIETTYRQGESNKTKYVLDDITFVGQPGLFDDYKLAFTLDDMPEYEVGDKLLVKGTIYCQSLYYDSNINLYGPNNGEKYRGLAKDAFYASKFFHFYSPKIIVTI